LPVPDVCTSEAEEQQGRAAGISVQAGAGQRRRRRRSCGIGPQGTREIAHRHAWASQRGGGTSGKIIFDGEHLLIIVPYNIAKYGRVTAAPLRHVRSVPQLQKASRPIDPEPFRPKEYHRQKSDSYTRSRNPISMTRIPYNDHKYSTSQRRRKALLGMFTKFRCLQGNFLTEPG
jgi:hypothetical protein